MGWTLHMIMCVLLCYPVSIRIYYQQGVLFLVFGLFGDIFTLNADYIAWKLLKMALEVEYMMDFYHPGLLVTDLHLRSSTDRQST